MKRERVLLLAGIAVPILYFAAVFGGSLLYPGYDHLSQYASELGMADQRSAPFFNSGIAAAGLAAVIGAVGIYRVASREGGRRAWSMAAGVMLALFGAAMVMGGLFAMPDPRHGAYGLGMAAHLAPAALAIALWPAAGRRRLSWYLIGTALAMAILLAPMMGVGGLVTRANVGAFQRVYALALFVWIGVASAGLRSRAST
jgi:hypothetical membrane protein